MPLRVLPTPDYRPTLRRPHWSYSALAQYLRCPLQYYFERVLRLVRPTQPAALVLGSVVHEALAAYHRSVFHDEPWDHHTVGDCFLSSWKTRSAERPLQLRAGETTRDLVDRGIALLEVYLREPPPRNVVEVEYPIAVPLQTSGGQFLDRPLFAVIDLVRQHDLTTVAVEFKTSSRRYSDQEVAVALQATCYAYALNEHFDLPTTVEYMVLVKSVTPTIQHLTTGRTVNDFRRLGDLCQAVGQAIRQGIFHPIESPQNCSTCSFRAPCRDWRGTGGRNRTPVRLHQPGEEAC